MANPNNANVTTVQVKKKSGEVVTQTTTKGPGGTTITEKGKVVFRRKRGGRGSRPERLALAIPEKERLKRIAAEGEAMKIAVEARAQEIVKMSPGGDPRELFRKNIVSLGASGARLTPRPEPIREDEIPQRVEVEQSIKKEKGFFGKLLESPEAAIGEPISAAAFMFSGGTIGSDIGFDKAKEPPALVRGVTEGGVALKEFGGSLKENEKPFAPIRPSGILIAAGAIIEDFGKRPALNVAVLSAGFLVGKVLGFGKGLLTSAAVTGPKPTALVVKGVVKGVTATAVGLGALDIVTSDKPQERAAVVIKDFALFGLGAKQGFESGVQSSVKFRAEQALKAQRTGLIEADSSLSRNIKVTAKVREVKGLTLVEQTGGGVKSQRAFLDAGKSKIVNVRDIPKSDFVKVSATGKKITKFDDFAVDTIKGGIIKSDVQFVKTTKTVVLDKKAFGTIVSQADLGVGRTSKIDFSGKTSRSVVKLSFEGKQFSGERAVFDPTPSAKPGKVLRLVRSKPLTPAQSGQIIEFDVAAKKPGTPFLSIKGQAALQKEVGESIVLLRPAKTVKVFKVDALKAQPTQKFAKEIKVIKDEGTGLATVQLLRSETVKVKEPELETKTVAKRKVETKSLFEENQAFDVTKQGVFIKAETSFGRTSQRLTSQRFRSVAGLSSKSDTSLSSALRSSQKQTAIQKTGEIQVSGLAQLPAQRISQLTESKAATDSITRQAGFSQTTQFLSRARQLPSPVVKTQGFNIGFFSSGEKGLFSFEVGKQGNKIRKFIQGTNFEETVLRTRKFVKGTAAASFRSVQPLSSFQESQVSSLLGGEFRRAKRDPSRFVQKRSKRISSLGEKKDITFKGLAALRFQRLRGFRL